MDIVQQSFKQDSLTINALLQQARPVLSVKSLLHQVPHMLENRLMHGRMFKVLEQLKQQGNQLEQTLSGLSLDILSETRREWNFYQGMLNVYETVVSAPDHVSSCEVKHQSEIAFQQAFSEVNYKIEGIEHLPKHSGHIFILNHLISHPSHVLPNLFELSLDTHFVSAMILKSQYGDGGVRVVRHPKGHEFAHQRYYRRLGNISVFTHESDPEAHRKSQAENQLDSFIQAAQQHLSEEKNLVICPEGTSNHSAGSPGRFKAGAFILAGRTQPEPLIVPIALANFDKPLRYSTLVATIKPPFYISDHVDVNDRDSLHSFLTNYQKTYRGYVEEAHQIADSISENKNIRCC